MDELSLRNLTVRAPRGRTLVDGVSLAVQPGELVGVVGASGSGKSLTARSLLGLLPAPLEVQAALEVPTAAGIQRPYAVTGRARARAFQNLRGTTLALLPQEAGRSLDPFRTVGQQLARVGRGGHAPAAVQQALVAAGFAAPSDVLDRYPHELSGGMAQRVALAALWVVGAPFLICDEPTTGLDAAVQRSLMATLRGLAERGRAVIVVSHALRWLHDGADRLVVFEGGRITESVSRGQALASEAGRRLQQSVDATASPGFPPYLSGESVPV